MAEYIEREAVVKAFCEHCRDYVDKCTYDGTCEVDIIATVPTADVQPVVHCKDCKYRKERHYEESGEKPYIKYECKFTKYSMSDDGFCSFGAKMLEKPNLQLLKDAVELIQKAKEIKVDGARMEDEGENETD